MVEKVRSCVSNMRAMHVIADSVCHNSACGAARCVGSAGEAAWCFAANLFPNELIRYRVLSSASHAVALYP